STPIGPSMKTLRVTLADIVGPTGTPNSTATVHARYVDTSGRGRDVHLTDGTIVVPVRRVASPDGDPEVFDFDVYANDVAPVREVDYGHLVEVSWTVVAPTGAKTSGVQREAITDDMDAVVQLGLLATPVPVPPYTGGYVLPAELDALDARGGGREAGGGGGGGGVTVHNLLTGRSTADAHPTSAITGLDSALAGKATTAQGAKADTAVQPADLTAGLATKAATAHTHAIADTTGLQAALDAKADDLGADDNYVTDAEKTKLANLSGTNTGDQTLPTWTTIAGKPVFVAEGATNVAARTALGLGTAATTASTAYATSAQGTLATNAVPNTRSVIAGTGLTGGGALSADRTLTVAYGTSGTTAAVGNDARLSDARTPTAHVHAAADVTSGTVAYARLPVGTTASTVAAGDDSRITGALQATTAQAINAQTGTSYTLVSGDAGKVVTLSNAGAITLNAPGSVFTAGQRIDLVVIGAGMATVVGTSGATANPAGGSSLVSRAQYSAFTILWTSATACVVIGDLA
ncbi:MAG: hypothetical protein L0I24_17700, partial [Pseudonocardia sp.]|nr:hypothetical protein [Pseudonocardia sp.]